MTVKRVDSGRAVEEYIGKATDGLAWLLESKKWTKTIIMFFFKIPMIIKRVGSGRVAEEYSDVNDGTSKNYRRVHVGIELIKKISEWKIWNFPKTNPSRIQRWQPTIKKGEATCL